MPLHIQEQGGSDAEEAEVLFAGRAGAVVQRGNDRQPVFFGEQDYGRYREWLRKGAEQCGCAIHSYVLMTNHVRSLTASSRRLCETCLTSGTASVGVLVGRTFFRVAHL